MTKSTLFLSVILIACIGCDNSTPQLDTAYKNVFTESLDWALFADTLSVAHGYYLDDDHYVYTSDYIDDNVETWFILEHPVKKRNKLSHSILEETNKISKREKYLIKWEISDKGVIKKFKKYNDSTNKLISTLEFDIEIVDSAYEGLVNSGSWKGNLIRLNEIRVFDKNNQLVEKRVFEYRSQTVFEIKYYDRKNELIRETHVDKNQGNMS